MELHERARQARLDAGISINSLAELMGVDRGIIQRMEWRPATTLQQLETQKKVVTLGPDGLMRAMVTAKSMKAKAKDAQAVKVESKAELKVEPKAAPKAAPKAKAKPKKNQRLASTHAGRTCPVCGAVTNAPRFSFLCKEHRTDENLKKFARKEVPAGTVEAVEVAPTAAPTAAPAGPVGLQLLLEKMKKVQEMRNMIVAPPAPHVEVTGRDALARNVVTLALTTMKSETSFSALADLALKALDEI